MKKALKWLGWGVLALIGLGVFLSLEKSTQSTLVIVGIVWWVVSWFWKEIERRHRELMSTLNRVEKKLDDLAAQPLYESYLAQGLEGIVDEHRDRKRRRDSAVDSDWPVAPLSDDWPFAKRG